MVILIVLMCEEVDKYGLRFDNIFVATDARNKYEAENYRRKNEIQELHHQKKVAQLKKEIRELEEDEQENAK